MYVPDARLQRLAGILLASTLVALVLSACFLWLNRATLEHSEPWDVANTYLASIGFGGMGAMIAMQRPRHPVGWLLAVIGLLYAAPTAAMEAAIWLASRSRPSPWLGALQGDLVATAQVGAFTAVAILFPQGRLPGRRWRIAVVLLIAAVVAALAAEPFTPSAPRSRDPGLAYRISVVGDSPFAEQQVVEGDVLHGVNASLVDRGLHPAEGSSWVAPAIVLVGPRITELFDFLDFAMGSIALLVLGTALIRLVVVAVRATGVTRLQMKWLAYVVLVAIALVVLSAAPFPYVTDLHLVASIVLALGVPWAVGVAITRHGLYEIDRVINRTVVYTIVVAALAGLFTGGVALASTVLPTGSSDLGVAVSTLAVAALFNPLRRRVQAVVNRRFYRSRYDPQQVAEALSTRLRDRIDRHDIGDAWVDAVSTTLQPAAAGVWVKEDR